MIFKQIEWMLSDIENRKLHIWIQGWSCFIAASIRLLENKRRTKQTGESLFTYNESHTLVFEYYFANTTITSETTMQ